MAKINFAKVAQNVISFNIENIPKPKPQTLYLFVVQGNNLEAKTKFINFFCKRLKKIKRARNCYKNGYKYLSEKFHWKLAG